MGEEFLGRGDAGLGDLVERVEEVRLVAVEALRAGELDGLVLQDPMKMGYGAVKTLVERASRQPWERRAKRGASRSLARASSWRSTSSTPSSTSPSRRRGSPRPERAWRYLAKANRQGLQG